MSVKKESATNKSNSQAITDDVYTVMRGEIDFEKVPACIYFYYVGEDGKTSKNYYYTDGENKPIHYDKVQGIVQRLAANAAASGRDPPQDGINSDHLVWSRVSYLAFVLSSDQASWDGQAIKVTADDGEPKHGFYDGMDKQIDIGGGKMRWAAWCINYMKDMDWKDLGNEDRTCRLDLQIKTGKARKKVPWPDSGGTNMGPPVPPP